VVILGIPFHNVSFADTVEWVRQRVRLRRPVYIATANMDFLTQAWRDPELQRILIEADLVVADGIPIVWLSRILGYPLKERVTGSDLVPLFAELAAREGFSVYGLGGAEGVAEKALKKLSERFPGMRIAGAYSPPKAEIIDMDNAGILARLEKADPDLLLVAFGGPKQEKWCNMHLRHWKIPVAIGIGGSLDFIAGTQKRAPCWVQRLALEWLWRMLSNPRRLFCRYFTNIVFLFAAGFRMLWLRWGPVPSSQKSSETLEEEQAVMAAESPVSCVRFPSSVADLEAEDFRSACEAATGPLILDMDRREWLDGRELGELLSLNRRCRSARRWLCLLVPNPRLESMLKFIRMDRYIQMASDRQTALRMLYSWKQARQDVCIKVEPDRRLTLLLAAELTAANVPGIKAKMEAAWSQAAADGEVSGVTVDASAVTFLDSAGLGFLVALRKKALPLSGGFRCAGFHGNARQTLAIARMEALFTDGTV
jgi:N-acetylglucosaminyldiphosphoundecaprenol N-acetyl-beta-D-mannosaminyltransferase